MKFADNIVLLDSVLANLQTALDKTEDKSIKYGMTINKIKTESMIFCRAEKENRLKIKLEEETLKNVPGFKHLGVKFKFDNDCSAKIRHRFALASYAYSKLKKIWNNDKLPIKTKLRVLKTYVFSTCTLTYGAETWVIKKEDELKINAFEMKCCRWILIIKWFQRIRNIDIRKQIEAEEDIVTVIYKKQPKWFGHVARMDDKRWAIKLLNVPGNGKSLQGSQENDILTI